MGGCYFTYGSQFIEQSNLVNQGPFKNVTQEVNPASYPEQTLSKEEAAYRVIKHHEALSKVNPYGQAAFDSGMRAALTYMLTDKKCTDINKNSHLALRYVRDRISVPRDMNIWSAKRLR
jgi:glutathione S-transferase